MKKVFVPTLLLAAFISCTQVQPKKTDRAGTAQTAHFINVVLGKWTMCSTEFIQDEGTSITRQYNVCPKITFNKNHSGFIEIADPKLIYFTWIIDDDKLSIRFPKNNDSGSTVIHDGALRITFSKKKLYNELTLYDTIRKIKYNLGR